MLTRQLACLSSTKSSPSIRLAVITTFTARRTSLKNATAAVARYKEQIAIVWNAIWRGRGIYFLPVLASLYLVIYPLALTIPRDGESTTCLRAVSDIIALLSIPLPNAANRWYIPVRSDPAHFLITAVTIALLMYLGSGLHARIAARCAR